MKSDLKELHPYLYRRVRLKGWLFSLLGLSSIFHTQLDALFHTERNNAPGISMLITGVIFLVIGVGILIGLYAGKHTWSLSRYFLIASAIYAIFWEFILVQLLITKHISTVSVFLLWGYLTTNLCLIATDSAWGGVILLNAYRNRLNGKR